MEQSAIDFLLCANRKFLEIWKNAKDDKKNDEKATQLALKEMTLEQKEHRELSNRYDRVGLECAITVWKGTDTQPG